MSPAKSSLSETSMPTAPTSVWSASNTGRDIVLIRPSGSEKYQSKFKHYTANVATIRRYGKYRHNWWRCKKRHNSTKQPLGILDHYTCNVAVFSYLASHIRCADRNFHNLTRGWGVTVRYFVAVSSYLSRHNRCRDRRRLGPCSFQRRNSCSIAPPGCSSFQCSLYVWTGLWLALFAS